MKRISNIKDNLEFEADGIDYLELDRDMEWGLK